MRLWRTGVFAVHREKIGHGFTRMNADQLTNPKVLSVSIRANPWLQFWRLPGRHVCLEGVIRGCQHTPQQH
jgi:hypothetical protein